MKIHLLQYLEKTYSNYKDKVAIIDRDRQLTFAELKDQSISISIELKKHKKELSNQPVAVLLPKSLESIVSFTAVLYSGGFYVPLDSKSPIERIESIIDTLSPGIIITNQSLKAKLLNINYPGDKIVEYESLVQSSYTDIGKYTLPDNHIDTNPAYCKFTSGSTGIPKGVVIPHRAVIDYIDWAIERFEIDDQNVIGNQSPLFFDQSVFDIYLMMATGSTMVLIPEELFIFPAKLLEYLNEVKVSLFFWVPSVLVNIANFKLLDVIELPCLEKIFFGGEVMSTRHLNYWRKHLPSPMYINMYGPTETTVDCTYYVVDREIPDEESVPIGFPCHNTGVLILNEKNEAAKVNETGELCVRGSSLGLGYYNNPDKTAEVFVQNPLNKHYPEKIYRTGDVVYLNNLGEIIYLCRKDNQIQHMGYRIELGEIEVAVMGVGWLQNACVLYDNDRKEIVLYYSADKSIEPRALRKQLIQKLPKYMIPSSYIQLAEMPLNANGKIDRNTLKMQLEH